MEVLRRKEMMEKKLRLRKMRGCEELKEGVDAMRVASPRCQKSLRELPRAGSSLYLKLRALPIAVKCQPP